MDRNPAPKLYFLSLKRRRRSTINRPLPSQLLMELLNLLKLSCGRVKPYEFFLLFPFHLQDPHPFSLIFGILVEDERKSKKKMLWKELFGS